MPSDLDLGQCSKTVQSIVSHYDMKINLRPLLGSSLLAALVFTGCSKSEKAADPATTTPAPAPGAVAASKPATGRAIAFTANDTMKFNLTEIRAKPGEAL